MSQQFRQALFALLAKDDLGRIVIFKTDHILSSPLTIKYFVSCKIKNRGSFRSRAIDRYPYIKHSLTSLHTHSRRYTLVHTSHISCPGDQHSTTHTHIHLSHRSSVQHHFSLLPCRNYSFDGVTIPSIAYYVNRFSNYFCMLIKLFKSCGQLLLTIYVFSFIIVRVWFGEISRTENGGHRFRSPKRTIYIIYRCGAICISLCIAFPILTNLSSPRPRKGRSLLK